MKRNIFLISILLLLGIANTTTEYNYYGVKISLVRVNENNAEHYHYPNRSLNFNENNIYQCTIANQSSKPLFIPGYSTFIYSPGTGYSFPGSNKVWVEGSIVKGCLTNLLCNVILLPFGIYAATSRGFQGEWEEVDAAVLLKKDILLPNKSTTGFIVFSTTTQPITPTIEFSGFMLGNQELPMIRQSLQ